MRGREGEWEFFGEPGALATGVCRTTSNDRVRQSRAGEWGLCIILTMWYVWFTYIAQLLIGTAFLLSVRYSLFPRFLTHWHRLTQRVDEVGTGQRLLAAVRVVGSGIILLPFTAAGLFAVIFTLTGPTPLETFALEHKVLNVTPDTIRDVEILPSDSETYRLIDKAIPIVKPGHLNQLCDAIRSAQRDVPNHPRTIWDCYLRFCVEKTTYLCHIYRTENQGLQLRICPDSDDTGRWGASHFRCDRLRPLLLEFTGKRDERPGE